MPTIKIKYKLKHNTRYNNVKIDQFILSTSK